MIITLKNANFSENNVGQLNSWFIFAPTVSGGVVTVDSNNPSSIDKTTLPATTLKYTFDTAKYNFISCTPSVGTATHSNGLITVIIPQGTTIVANITISIALERIGGDTGGEEEEPETTNYTFTINPDPTSATVTLSATGYSTVSGTGSKSITVANGTKVNWSVSADGYTTRTGNWTISGGNKTENIVLVASDGTGTVTELTFETSGFYNNSSQGGGITSPNTSWYMSDLIPINTLTNNSDGYCTSMLQGHSRVAVVYYASSNNTDSSAFLGNYGTTTQGETVQYTAEEVKENAPEGTVYVGFSTHTGHKPLRVYVLQ